MAALLTAIGSIVTASVGWMGSFVTAIVSPGNELLLLFCLIGFVGTGIGLLGRLKHA